MTLTAASRPKLAGKARLRWDEREGKYLLLYPERGLLLNATAADIARLCTGEHTVGGIVEQLAGKYPGKARGEIESEVMVFLAQIAGRGLLEATE